MARKVRDGWHEYYGREVYVENNRVLRGLRNNKTVHPFRYNGNKTWINISGVSVDGFISGIRRGTVDLF